MVDRKTRIYNIKYETVYPMYLEKVEKKGRTKAELNEVLSWLTGLKHPEDYQGSYEAFQSQAQVPASASEIKGLICGVRVEEIEDPVIKFMRQMDKVVDELAKGKTMEKIIR
ncbi:MAG: DUF2200 family protein [Lactovum sp.]